MLNSLRATFKLDRVGPVDNRVFCENIFEDGAFSHKVDFVTIVLEVLNLKGHPYRITGSIVTAILLNEWSFICGGSAINGATSFIFYLQVEKGRGPSVISHKF